MWNRAHAVLQFVSVSHAVGPTVGPILNLVCFHPLGRTPRNSWWRSCRTCRTLAGTWALSARTGAQWRQRCPSPCPMKGHAKGQWVADDDDGLKGSRGLMVRELDLKSDGCWFKSQTYLSQKKPSSMALCVCVCNSCGTGTYNLEPRVMLTLDLIHPTIQQCLQAYFSVSLTNTVIYTHTVSFMSKCFVLKTRSQKQTWRNVQKVFSVEKAD